ncbi:MAG: hypothetical protein GXO75_08215 [Calditrichaeota bacterium]|nr:hypothetical protein [Calditrichota bacterium]
MALKEIDKKDRERLKMIKRMANRHANDRNLVTAILADRMLELIELFEKYTGVRV